MLLFLDNDLAWRLGIIASCFLVFVAGVYWTNKREKGD